MTSTSSTADTATPWTLAGLVAHHAGGQIDLASPAAGLAVASGDQILGLDLKTAGGDARLIDPWVRGDDLIGVYEPLDPRRLLATALSRSLPGAHNAWELVVSAQTSLVESDSSVAVTCDLAAGDIAWGCSDPKPAANGVCSVVWTPLKGATCPPEATCLLVRRPTAALLLAVYPCDIRRIVVAGRASRLTVNCWLFSAAIEKGVLLRSRVLAASGPAGDTTWADALVTALAASPRAVC